MFFCAEGRQEVRKRQVDEVRRDTDAEGWLTSPCCDGSGCDTDVMSELIVCVDDGGRERRNRFYLRAENVVE